MVTMAGLQVFIVRFFFQGARKGEWSIPFFSFFFSYPQGGSVECVEYKLILGLQVTCNGTIGEHLCIKLWSYSCITSFISIYVVLLGNFSMEHFRDAWMSIPQHPTQSIPIALTSD